ncbi:MAG: M67 family metallopeptidase [Actinomycetota bacterium]|nr:M67 family metallopeptidase [Actinomycetota bacterium]
MSEVQLAEMVRHCQEERPNEGCGVLAAADGRIVKVIGMTNASASPVRYQLDPREQFAVYRTLDQQGWDLGGIFHSHTHTEAYPSPTDVRLASEEVPYVIVSFATDPPTIRGFRINKEWWTDEQGEILEIPIVVQG